MLLSTTKDLLSPLLQAFFNQTFTFRHTTDSVSEHEDRSYSSTHAGRHRKPLSRKSVRQVIKSEIAAMTDEKSVDLHGNELRDSHGVGIVFLEASIFNIS